MRAKQIEAFGKSYKSIGDLALAYNVGRAALSKRLAKGELPEDAVNALIPIIVKNKSFKNVVEIARYFNVPEATLRHRVKKLGMTFEDAVTLPVKELKTGPVTIEEVEYTSFAAAAKAYGKDPEAARNRMRSGMSAEEAILEPNKRNKPIVYLGEKYESHTKLAVKFGLHKATFFGRLRNNWDLQEAIEKPVMKNHQIIFDGQEFNSLNSLCENLNVNYKLVYKRWNLYKWPLRLAIETPKKISGREIIVNGKIFSSIKETAQFYGIDSGLLSYRINAGWVIEQAVDPNAEVENRKPIEIDGEYFENSSDAARAYNLNPGTFLKRIREGWTIEQAAGLIEPPERNIGTPPVSPEEYQKRLYEVHGDNLDFSKSVFGKSQEDIEVVCKIGNEHQTFWATPNNLLQGKGCPICKLSHGARKVAQWLDNNDIKYEAEWTGHGLKSKENEKATLRIDFHLPEHRIVIEFDGEQHYRPVTFGGISWAQAEIAYKKLKENDSRKNRWAAANKYKMIRIKYDQPVAENLSKNIKI